jgi:hypothetical protein
MKQEVEEFKLRCLDQSIMPIVPNTRGADSDLDPQSVINSSAILEQGSRDTLDSLFDQSHTSMIRRHPLHRRRDAAVTSP